MSEFLFDLPSDHPSPNLQETAISAQLTPSTGSFADAAPETPAVPQGSVDEVTAGLNPPQLEAVTSDSRALLVMAGAGSGKTRVLTRRIAYLLATGQAWPSQILAITFTNKAAKEMAERIANLVGDPARRIWTSTFHSACARILREEHEAAGLRSSFTIYDAADSKRLLKEICKNLDIDSKVLSVKALAGRISDQKNLLIDPDDYAARGNQSDPYWGETLAVYREYQAALRRHHALDFDDLIMTTVNLLRAFPQVQARLRRRWRYILVDEYQDTNPAQYALIRELVGTADDASGLPPTALTVVGDSDQSIYAFRGATIRNIEEFADDFPGAHTVYLEQNYRSTGTILNAANALIAGNSSRHKKKLWTDAGAGLPITVYAADTEADEARWIVSEIEGLRKAGRAYGDIAVFYRTNSQSRSFEEILVRSAVPYRIVGGTRFYERREIKDIVAYLRAGANPDDEVNLRRVLNVPKRGLGDKAEAEILGVARGKNLSFGEVCEGIADGTLSADLTPRAVKAVADFIGILRMIREEDERGTPMGELLEMLLDRSGYLAPLQVSTDPQDATRVENLGELVSVASEFSAAEPSGRLVDFLERVSLVADSDQLPDYADPDSGQVTLMTVHTAKGLEFPVVFVTGLEEEIFPHSRSLLEPGGVEEERRLAYVAVTRAQELLYLTRAGSRSLWGGPSNFAPSRFLTEIPEDLCDVRRRLATRENYTSYVTPRKAGGTSTRSREGAKKRLSQGGPLLTSAAKMKSSQPHKTAGPKAPTVGKTVKHSLYGKGVVLSLEGEGEGLIAKVNFDTVGVKRLMLRFAPLEEVE